jgi:predicted DNA-binding ribbon-helix-helix protein
MVTAKGDGKQNVTIRLERKTIQKAKIIAAQRSTSLGALLACDIERLVGDDENYGRSKRRALVLLDKGFHLGGKLRASRDELHER